MKKYLSIICAAALFAGCSTENGGPTVFQGRFIGYGSEYVEFFIPQDDGTYLEIPLNVKEDGTFCDTIQFKENLYDAALFADKFMFRVSVEQGKTYNAEFDITQEGVETNFRFTGEGEAENRFMSHLWALDEMKGLQGASSYKEFVDILSATYAPLREELATIPNKPFVKYYNEVFDGKVETYSYYFPFFASKNTGTTPDDADFNAFVAKKKKVSDEQFGRTIETVCTNVPYYVKNINALDAVKAAGLCSVNPSQKELAMVKMVESMIGSGNNTGLEEAYEYLGETIQDEDYLDHIDEICRNALLLAPGSDAPDIEFQDINGKVYHLSDFAGKPLYVDLWASWCGPCCEEIPYLAKFVESLGKNPQIVCISISTDEERDEWTKKLDEEKPAWPQFIATQAGQESISNQYFVTGIPRFMLFDANGKIASVNAPRPSSPDLLEELLSLL